MGKKGFRGMPPMGGNNMNMMKQVQKMQQEMMKMQEELKTKEFETTVGGGALSVKMNGEKELTSVTIDPDVVDADDVEMLQDLIISAVNEVIRKVDKESAQNLNKMTGGLDLKGLGL